MLSNKKNNMSGSNDANSINVFGEGTTVEGNITSKGDVRIDGKLIGAINTSAKVVLGETGIIEGDLVATGADISGTVNGNVRVKGVLLLKSSARINGDIYTNKLQIESGGMFNGKCEMGSNSVPGKGTSNAAANENAAKA
jgi:cytoskeletal protein CcmA (bactofilin family)